MSTSNDQAYFRRLLLRLGAAPADVLLVDAENLVQTAAASLGAEPPAGSSFRLAGCNAHPTLLMRACSIELTLRLSLSADRELLQLSKLSFGSQIGRRR
jgi:hypothetical protein